MRLPALLLLAALVAGCAHPAAQPTAPAPPAPAATATATLARDGTFLPAPAAALPGNGTWDPFAAAVAAGQPVAVKGVYTADNRTTRLTYSVDGKLPHLERTFLLQLAPSPVANATWFEVDGRRVAAPLVHGYAGSEVGHPANQARLTVTPRWLRGMVYDGDHAFDVAQGDFPLPDYVAGNGGTARSGSSHRAPAGPAPHADPLQCVSDPVVGGERDPRSFKPEVRSGPSAEAPLHAHLVMDADAALVALMGNATAAYLVAEAQELDLIFAREAAVQMRLDGVAVHTASPGGSDVFGTLKQEWDGRETGRDLLVGFTASLRDIRGLGETGQAYCIGAAGTPGYAYAFVGVDPATFNGRGIRYILGHEVEHLFNAEHHDANDVETDACTLMAICAPAAGLNYVLGSIERGYVRGWAETHLQHP